MVGNVERKEFIWLMILVAGKSEQHGTWQGTCDFKIPLQVTSHSGHTCIRGTQERCQTHFNNSFY
jgi:hypothetical protein